MPEHRRLAHLPAFARQPIVFLTVVTHERQRCLDNRLAYECLSTIWRKSPEIDGWFVGDYLLMPDHVHLFARAAPSAKSLAHWLATWKSLSSRTLGPTSHAAVLWQRDYFDRYLRSTDDYTEKWHYVAMNPVRKRLAEKPEDWPWKGRLADLQF